LQHSIKAIFRLILAKELNEGESGGRDLYQYVDRKLEYVIDFKNSTFSCHLFII
jgi:hypothetical protein